MSLKNRISGSLVGLAVGDALGAPVERIPGSKFDLSHINRPVAEMIGGGWLNLKPGQVTDDTEMALCIARSYDDKKRFDPADIAYKFLKWHENNPIGTGGTIYRAIQELKAGKSWQESGMTEYGLKSLGNGSVMRCAPIALVNHSNYERLIKESHDQSVITHPHSDCTDSSIFVNVLIASLICKRDKFSAYADALSAISGNASLLDRYASSPHVEKLSSIGTVRETVECAVNSFLTTDSLEEAIIKSVNLGGDADTIGAVTGAIAGACYGENAIPGRWKLKLVDRNTLPLYRELLALSDSLYVLSLKRKSQKQ